MRKALPDSQSGRRQGKRRHGRLGPDGDGPGPSPQPFHSRWDRKFESGYLQGGVRSEPRERSPSFNRGRQRSVRIPGSHLTRGSPDANKDRSLPCPSSEFCTSPRTRRPIGTAAALIGRGSLSRLNGGPDKDPVSLPICVPASIVVLPFVMRFYLNGVKREVQETLLARSLGFRSLE
jgi:hypothetical protein